ncbi:MAG TPA: hypothetical protein VNU45_01230 [Rummeliibacillus sp.]|nr:hypothetical protein [Rummeliibacillus sp.]
MRKTSKFLIILGIALIISIVAFSFYQKEKANTETDKYVPKSHSDTIFFLLP